MKHLRTLLISVLPILAATQAVFADAAIPDPVDRVSGMLPALGGVAAAIIGAVLVIRNKKK